MTKAIVFVRSDEFDPHVTRCAAYAEEQGYEVTGVVLDDWGAVQKMLNDGQAGVAVVSTGSHLPSKRRPRVEVVEHMHEDQALHLRHGERSVDADDSRHRRPRPIG